jgi:hypothetical protein
LEHFVRMRQLTFPWTSRGLLTEAKPVEEGSLLSFPRKRESRKEYKIVIPGQAEIPVFFLDSCLRGNDTLAPSPGLRSRPASPGVGRGVLDCGLGRQ